MINYLCTFLPEELAHHILPSIKTPQQARTFCAYHKEFSSALEHFSHQDLIRAPELWLVSTEESRLRALWLKEVYPKNIERTVDITDSILKCGKCNKNTVDYYEKQTRGADEPMTLFANCLTCGNRWRQ